MESAPYPARKRPDGVAPPRAPMGPESPIHCPKGPTAEGRQTRLALGSCDWRGRGRNWVLPMEQPWNTAPDGRRFRATLTLRARAAQWRLSAPGELRQCVHLDYNSQKPPRRGAPHVVGGGHLGGQLGAVGEAPGAERVPLVIPLDRRRPSRGKSVRWWVPAPAWAATQAEREARQASRAATHGTNGKWRKGRHGRGRAGSAEGRGELLTPNVERGGAGRKCLEAAVKLVPLGSAVKSWPAVQKIQKTRVRSLGRQNRLAREMAAHFSILA